MDTSTIAIIILLVSFVLLILLRFPIALTLIISSLLTVIYLDVPWAVIGQQMTQGMNSFSLLAIPFFILTGQIMGEGGLALRIVNLARLLVGRVRGGLAMVNSVASLFFGNISGSAVADVSSVGSVMIPMMKKQGYEADYSVGVTIASAIQGVVVPPSHNLVLYSLAAGGVSIASLFMAGIVPGVIMLISLMITAYIIARKRGYQKAEPVPKAEIGGILLHGILSLSPAVIILGGILSGWFTATESGALACLYSFILAFGIYREAPLKSIGKILIRTMKTVAMVFFLIAASAAFGWILAYLQVPAMVTDLFLTISDNPLIILLIINILLLLLGAPMDMAPMILIMTPILLPVVTSFGMDPVHFGIVLILNAGIGLLTPPVGTVLFVGCAIGKVSIQQGTKAMLPFFYALLIVLLIITYIPEVVMWLPNMLAK
ncbi:TRAP transporter large permease [Metabacillus sediminilitoris]|uniref:TRAP transporter large permease n=1 Tax=Metabacillus sediminilitoris TaxID=2567941 RepID=A0A4S4C5H2_9BACI|nr:TRAP transporter large permease [Metabacillus sediminilitoris]QGQ45207.1 TRAP transporter large permease subunit [Metabacillus sediminilitoris]THF82494.1 TRAP transporter large permease [Metabacillus sediminilitoris]